MSDTVRFFRDRLTIDLDLITKLAVPGTGTLVLGAREVELAALSPSYHYVIVADHLTVPPHAGMSLVGDALEVTVLALDIAGALQLTCAGADGTDGADGEPGQGGADTGSDDSGPLGKPVILPGGDGEPGGDGGDGAPGGTITVHYASATQPPTGAAPGGVGGHGGAGGAGGAGRPPGRAGRAGTDGRNGAAGVVEIRQLPAAEVWQALDAASTAQWAAYRAEVAGFFFRKFDPESQLTALSETDAALRLNPQDADALTIRDRILNRQIPSGLARDLDIAADFPDLSASLVAEIAVVQAAFGAYQQQLPLLAIADSVRTNLGALEGQLVHRQQEARADVVIAQQDVDIAKAEKANLQAQVEQVRKDIAKAEEQSFSFGDMLTKVGTIAGAIAGIATGAGAIVSIPAGIAALQSVTANGRERTLWDLLGSLKNQPKDPKHPKTYEYDVLNAAKLGGDLKDLVSGAKDVISFVDVIDDLDAGASQAGQAEVARLLKQQATLVRQQMVATLRETQAHSRVAAANLRMSNLGADIADIQQRLGQWETKEAVVAAATDILIRAARQLVDIVMDDVFLAQRAREIYELDGLPGLRFDHGYLHPDDDHSLGPVERGSATAASLVELPLQVLSWNQIFQRLNTAQIGFDVIHPALSLTITDPAQLGAFADGAVLAFSVGVADLPEGMFELKLNAIGVELRGAGSPQSANVWITHAGEWSMKRRTDGSVTAISLRPRSDVLAFGAGDGTLTASLPAHPQSSAEEGPPFPFWGRGVASTFRLQVALPSSLDLTGLSAIHVRLDCLGFAPQGSGTQPGVRPIRPDVRLLATPMAVPAVR
jgi:hypothetical protein